jgi:2-keto-4-pentenoate hydratase/2-oxohepta-3-ene-1,7-dioic acid hydratase in catechol pathway
MKFARFLQGPRIAYGIVEDEEIAEISTTPFLPYEPTGDRHSMADVRLLAPSLPSKIVAIGINYKDHAAEMGRELPEIPMFFYKPSTAVIGPGERIVRPPGCESLHYEGEMAVVIGSVARAVDATRWSEVVLGYTCGIDATARDFQAADLQWGRAKGFDTSAPLGPWIETEVDPSNLRIQTRINGETRQDSSTEQLVFGVGELIEFVTSFVTLLPGDVIMTGTPSGVGELKEGDRVEVEIEGIGTLEVSL